MNKINSRDRQHPASGRLPCVRLLEQTIQHWGLNASVRLAQSEDNEKEFEMRHPAYSSLVGMGNNQRGHSNGIKQR